MVQTSRPLNLGVVGYGYWGPNLVRILSELPGARLAAVCDSRPERLSRVRGRHPHVRVLSDAAALWKSPDIDAVCIVTPISTHFPLATAALNAGKHVFVEKPLAASVREASSLVALADRKKRTLMVGHTFEYSPPVLKIKEILDRGELGDLHYVSCTRVNLGIHQKDVSVLWDLGPHDFSILFFLLGEEPSSYSATGRACIQKGIPDVAFVDLQFPSGLVAHLEVSWLAPGKIRSTIIVGSKKMLVYDDTQVTEKVKIFDHGVHFKDPETFGEFQLSYRTGDILSPRIDTYEPLGAEMSHFIECCRTGGRPRSDGRSGLRVVRALELAEKSLRNGGKVVRRR